MDLQILKYNDVEVYIYKVNQEKKKVGNSQEINSRNKSFFLYFLLLNFLVKNSYYVSFIWRKNGSFVIC